MELIYMWIEEYKNLKNIGFNFSSKFDVEFNENHKYILIDKSETPNTFDGKIKEVTAIIGRNGSGKTNILDILGVKSTDRHNFKDYSNHNYFILYWIDTNKFVIEGNNINYLKETLNLSEDCINHIDTVYSVVAYLEENKLKFKSILQYEENTDGKLSDQISYFNFRHQYSNDVYGNFKSLIIEEEPSRLFQRNNLHQGNIGNSPIYKMLTEMNNIQNNNEQFLFNFQTNAQIKIELNLYNNDDFELSIEKGFIDRLNIFEKKKDISFNKVKSFINRFLYEMCKTLAYRLKREYEEQVFTKDVLQILNNTVVKSNEFQEYYLKIIDELLDLFDFENKEYFMKDDLKAYLLSIINKISLFPEDYFGENMIVIPINQDYNKNVHDFLLIFDNLNFSDDQLNFLYSIFSIDYINLSAGELALSSIFSALNFSLSLHNNNHLKTAIILLDEPDSSLHPEWSRIFLKELFLFLNRIKTDIQSFQIIITTHSPFIVSDLTRNSLIALKKDNYNNVNKIKIDEPFAANIHSLLAQEFFMSTTIGEYAKTKLNYIIDKIYDEGFGNLANSEKKEISYIISNIGDPLLRRKLVSITNDKNIKNQEIERLNKIIEELSRDDSNK